MAEASKVISFVRRLSVLGLAGIFLAAGLSKLWDIDQFVVDILNYRIVSGWWAEVVGLYLPYLEVVAAVALLVSGWRRSGAWLLLGLTTLFTLVILSAWVRGLDIACGCFGGIVQSTSVLWMLVRNIGILGGLLWLIYG